MIRSIEDKMEEARQYFVQKAGAEPDAQQRRHLEYCADLAEAVQETTRLIDLVKTQLEEVRHAVGRHVEVTGTVPHTVRRSGHPRGRSAG